MIQPLPSGQVSGPFSSVRAKRNSGCRPRRKCLWRARHNRRGRRSSCTSSRGANRNFDARSQSAKESLSRAADFCGAAEFERDGEFAADLRMCGEDFFEALELFAVFWFEADGGFDALLPAAVEEEALLRREAEIALVPDAVLQDAEIFEEFANVDRLWGRGRGCSARPRGRR